MKQKYSTILASRSIEDDFSRRDDAKNLKAFHNLKPFFSGEIELREVGSTDVSVLKELEESNNKSKCV